MNSLHEILCLYHDSLTIGPTYTVWAHKAVLRFVRLSVCLSVRPSLCLSRFLIRSRSLDGGMRVSPLKCMCLAYFLQCECYWFYILASYLYALLP